MAMLDMTRIEPLMDMTNLTQSIGRIETEREIGLIALPVSPLVSIGFSVTF